MKKFLALLLACAALLSLGVPAFAENTTSTEIDFNTPVVPVEKLETYDANDDKPMEVVHVDGEDYYAKLTEFGPVMVVCD